MSPAQTSGLDVFISYASRDRPTIEAIVQAFQGVGLSVWWDERIERGFWAAEIEDQIKAAKWVVAFLTDNAVDVKYDFIFAEMRLGRELGKLIPVRVGNVRIPFAYEGLIALVQNHFFPHASHIVDDPNFRRLCHACGARLDEPPTAIPAHASDPDTRVADWFSKLVTFEQVAFASALAVLENAPLGDIQKATQELTRILEPDPSAKSGAQDWGERAVRPMTRQMPLLVPRSSRLTAIEAETFPELHPRFGITLECCRFIDVERSAAFLRYVWTELDQLHDQLVRWLDHLAGTIPAEGRTRLSLALGVLAQREFSSVFDQVLRRWILDEHGGRREVADIALSVACFEPTVAKAVGMILRDWSGAMTSTRLLKAAVELSCGYTGMRLSGFSIETLKGASKARNKDISLIKTMERAIDDLLSAAMEIGDNSLLDFPRLIEELAEWIERSPPGETQRLPIYLFLHTLEDLPIIAPKGVAGVLSVAALMAESRTREPCARVLAVALRDPGDSEIGPREHATAILRNWADLQKRVRHADDPVLTLGRTLVTIAKTDRDRDRCIFLFRGIYSPHELVTPPSVENAS